MCVWHRLLAWQAPSHAQLRGRLVLALPGDAPDDCVPDKTPWRLRSAPLHLVTHPQPNQALLALLQQLLAALQLGRVRLSLRGEGRASVPVVDHQLAALCCAPALRICHQRLAS